MNESGSSGSKGSRKRDRSGSLERSSQSQKRKIITTTDDDRIDQPKPANDTTLQQQQQQQQPPQPPPLLRRASANDATKRHAIRGETMDNIDTLLEPLDVTSPRTTRSSILFASNHYSTQGNTTPAGTTTSSSSSSVSFDQRKYSSLSSFDTSFRRSSKLASLTSASSYEETQAALLLQRADSFDFRIRAMRRNFVFRNLPFAVSQLLAKKVEVCKKPDISVRWK